MIHTEGEYPQHLRIFVLVALPLAPLHSASDPLSLMALKQKLSFFRSLYCLNETHRYYCFNANQ